ncbi:MAG: YbhB/YbcL family Raf kinase inhibitor-like protein [Geobacteraceae bacterium]|nr:YbhB/YbcL family Raf kinase inhibitor-like protein [Geobacteraceae bacterium]
MKTIRLLILVLGTLAAAGASGKEGWKMNELRISSPAFEDNGSIPAKYTCDGLDASPPLVVGNVPAGARSLALIVDDPDAPAGTWVHWVLWNISPATAEIGENAAPPGAQQGKTDFGRNDYGGPCPPSGTHRYFFKLYALDATLSLGPATTKKALEKAMEGHVIARAQLIGLYKRR